MVISNKQDLMGIMAIGRICGLTLQHMIENAEVGMSTAELDEIGAKFLAKHKARSAPILAYRFPGHTCISINDEAAHGIPSKDKIIQAGDLVNIDVSAEKDGYWADCGMSIGMPPITPERQKMLDMTRGAFEVAFETAKAGMYVYEVGRAVEKFIVRNGYQVLDQLGGHGVGRGIHEAPSIPNWYNRTMRQKLEENGVITLEPFLSTRTRVVMQMPDGWTLKTSDGSLATQYEHTVIITKNKPILVTAIE